MDRLFLETKILADNWTAGTTDRSLSPSFFTRSGSVLTVNMLAAATFLTSSHVTGVATNPPIVRLHSVRGTSGLNPRSNTGKLSTRCCPGGRRLSPS